MNELCCILVFVHICLVAVRLRGVTASISVSVCKLRREEKVKTAWYSDVIVVDVFDKSENSVATGLSNTPH